MCDERKLEVVVTGLPLYNGAQIAVDCTLVSPLRRDGTARPRAHKEDGAALKDARKHKADTYPELLSSICCRLVTAGMEVGGCWDEEGYTLLEQLALAKAQGAPKVLRGSATRVWLKRWVALLSKTAMDSFAHTLVHGTAEDADLCNSTVPCFGAVLGDAPSLPANSRLGPK